MLEARLFSHLNLQASNLWVAYLQIPSFLKLGLTGSSNAEKMVGIVSSLESISTIGLLPFLLQSIDIPFPGLDVERQHGVNYLVDEDVPNTVQATFLETEDWQVTSLIRSWMTGYYDFDKRHFDFSAFTTGISFKTFCVIAYLQANRWNARNPAESWMGGHSVSKLIVLDKMFPIKMDPIQTEYTSGDPAKIGVTFAVDRVIDNADESDVLAVAESAISVSSALSSTVQYLS